MQKTHEQFVEEVEKKNGKVIILGHYVKQSEKIETKCKKCGYIWNPRPDSLLAGRACPLCGKHPQKTHEQFCSELSKIHPSIIPLEDYKGITTKIKFQCLVCKCVFEVTPAGIMKWKGCSNCERIEKEKSKISVRKKSKEEILEETRKQKATELAAMTFDAFDVIGTYVNAKTPVEVKCKKCNYIWPALPGNIRKNLGCPKCANNLRKDDEQFKREIAEKIPSITIIGEYINSKTRILTRCDRCGYEWKAHPSTLLKGFGCKKCNVGNSSYMEQFILISLSRLVGAENVDSKNKDIIGKELDIYVPIINLAIEPGSWFFHKSKEKEDKEKYELCKKQNVDLYIIYDSCDKSFTEDYIFSYGFDLRAEKNQSTLKELVLFFSEKYNLNTSLIDDDFWNDVARETYEKTLKQSTEEFAEKLHAVNKDLQVIGQYTGLRDTIRCKCKICGYEWNPRADHLLEGHGCSNCSGNRKLDHNEFINKMKSINPGIEILGVYENAKTRIHVKCKKCGNDWNPTPSELLNGNGCAKCARVKKRTHEEFIEEFTKLSMPIEICSEYISARKPIKARCLKCGREWSTTPDNLLQGYGCSKCAGIQKKSHKEFVEEMKQINSSIEILGEYRNNRTNIEVKCLKCGNIWQPLPSNLLKGTGCRKCYLAKINQR